MFSPLFHDHLVREREAEIECRAAIARRRQEARKDAEHAHRRQVDRVRDSLRLIAGDAPGQA